MKRLLLFRMGLVIKVLVCFGFCLGALGASVDSTPSSKPTQKDPMLLGSTVEPFRVAENLSKNVAFWIEIYTRYTTKQGLVHDAKYIDKIYEVLELDTGEPNRRVTQRSKKKWREVLLSLHHLSRKGKLDSPAELSALSADQRKVYDLFKDVQEPQKFLNAAHRKRLRFQLGQKDQFLSGLKQSGRYLAAMEKVFKQEQMPIELTRLPFVESSFNLKARSKVGASGIWQFMKSTARLFIKINPAVDERNDPIRATEAAARLLQGNYESLGSWPLAVTAYNHGRKGMMRAVRMVGTSELDELKEEYRSRSFGFASGNFFTELLAAIEVERNSEKYFGKVERDPPLEFQEVLIPDFIDFRVLVQALDLPLDRMRALNPALSDEVMDGHQLVPKGYLLRLPRLADFTEATEAAYFRDHYAAIPASEKQSKQLKLNYGRNHRLARKRSK